LRAGNRKGKKEEGQAENAYRVNDRHLASEKREEGKTIIYFEGGGNMHDQERMRERGKRANDSLVRNREGNSCMVQWRGFLKKKSRKEQSLYRRRKTVSEEG